jgi:hypothetical protein
MANLTNWQDKNYHDFEQLRSALFGRKIVNAETIDDFEGQLTLDDGTILRVGGNEGGCSCGAGDYPITTLNTVDNAITNVIVEENPDYDDGKCEKCDSWSCEHRGWYRIYVVAEDHTQHLVASFEGSDGNGYYGTGWWISVLPEKASQ